MIPVANDFNEDFSLIPSMFSFFNRPKQQGVLPRFYLELNKHYPTIRWNDNLISRYLKSSRFSSVNLPKEVHFILSICFYVIKRHRVNKESVYKLLEAMLKGANFKLQDDGALYKRLRDTYKTDIKSRISSHKSCQPQYALSGPAIKEALFGVSKDKHGNKSTWIQFERHTNKNIIDFILHMLDYVIYKITKKNVGPYGLSEHTEQNPYIIKRHECLLS